MIFKSVFICISCWGEKKPSASMSTQSYFEARGVEMVEAWKGNTNLYSEAQ